MLCAGFSLCYVQFAVTNLVASLRACLASLALLALLAAGASLGRRGTYELHKSLTEIMFIISSEVLGCSCLKHEKNGSHIMVFFVTIFDFRS